MMTTQSSLQDCYFYFYSSCTKGDECPFRHCELALGTETVCSLWREGRCFRSNCKFRHMESRINRSTIACYWENQPGGCRKPHCVFLHRKLRNGAPVIKDSPGLILPTSDGKTSPNLIDSNEANKVVFTEKADEVDVAPDPSLTPVPPLVLSFDEGEESDTESVSSTPVKQGDRKAVLTRNNMSVKTSDLIEEKDFGIKTLEQIRMEKIHKESDSYYGAAYTSTPLEAPRLSDQHYPPKAEFLSLPKDALLDKSSPAPLIETNISGVDEETDLRGRLSSRRNSLSNKVNQVKRLGNFKKLNSNPLEVVSKKLDFKIKTLEEIRKEKENKQSKSEVSLNNTQDGSLSLEEKPVKNNQEKTFRKLKINRKSREMYSVPAIRKQDISATNVTGTQLVSNDVKKEMLISSEQPIEEQMLKNSSDSPGKRKSDDDCCTSSSKILKLANGSCEQVTGIAVKSEKTDVNHLQLSIQRPEIQLSSAANEACGASSHNHTSILPNLKQDKVVLSQDSITKSEINGISTSIPLSPKSSHAPEEKSVSTSESQNSSTLLTTIKSDSGNDKDPRKYKDNLIERSMSVDDDLDEFLGDEDMNMDEMDATPNDDILLQIEEFLDS